MSLPTINYKWFQKNYSNQINQCCIFNFFYIFFLHQGSGTDWGQNFSDFFQIIHLQRKLAHKTWTLYNSWPFGPLGAVLLFRAGSNLARIFFKFIDKNFIKFLKLIYTHISMWYIQPGPSRIFVSCLYDTAYRPPMHAINTMQ